MSKKETRRAARDAFPKAKTTPANRLGSGRVPMKGSGVKGSGGSANRGAARYAPKPPTVKRAVIQGAIVTVIYFLVIQYAFKSGTALSNLIVSLIGFVIFATVAYFADRFKYQRYLRKQKGSSR